MIGRLFARWRRVPFIPQMEMSECGAACLDMILAFHGCHVPLAELREPCGVSRNGSSALDLVNAAKAYGLEPDGLQIEVEDLDEIELPAILHWGFNHFVVLERLHKSGVDLIDPAVGRMRATWSEVDESFTGLVLVFERGEDFQPRPRVRKTWERYGDLVRRGKEAVTTTILSAILLEVIGIVFPAATALVVDFVIRPRQSHWIPILAIAFLAAAAFRGGITYARDRIVGAFETKMNLDLAASLTKHLLSLPAGFFAVRGIGDLLNRVANLLTARDALARILVAGFDLLLVVAYAIVMVAFDPKLGAIVVGLYGAMVIGALAGGDRLRSATAKRLVAGGNAMSVVVQSFSDPEIPKAFHAESALANQYAVARVRELGARAEFMRALEPSKHALAVATALSSAAVLWLGGRAVLADRMTLGVLSSFLAIQALLGPPLVRVVAALRDIGDVVPLLDSVDDIFGTHPEPSGQFIPNRLRGEIVFENVSFRYGPKGPMLIDDVSFRVRAGERVAIVGASGSGKSTILKLMLGLLQPVSGRILLDGRDLRDYDLGALRAAVGAVLAGGTLFDETAFENVTLGAPDATPAQVRGALEAAGIAEVVDALPRGLLSRLGAGALRLSAGQRQRLLLARAIVKKPAMLLLDEASSALDAALERRVHANLAQLRCTILVVAHRRSAVGFADRVLSLCEGKVVAVEEGASGYTTGRRLPLVERLGLELLGGRP